MEDIVGKNGLKNLRKMSVNFSLFWKRKRCLIFRTFSWSAALFWQISVMAVSNSFMEYTITPYLLE